MKQLYALIGALLITLSFNPEGSGKTGAGESAAEYKKISALLLKSPSGPEALLQIEKLVRLSADGMEGETASIFRGCAKRLSASGRTGTSEYFLLTYMAGEFEGERNAAGHDFRGIDRWLISGIWRRYGRPDLLCKFPPEESEGFTGYSAESASTEGRRVLPFRFMHGTGGVVYSKTSVKGGAPLRIWVMANSPYLLRINGTEALHTFSYGDSVSGISVTGGRGYTLLLKSAGRADGIDPFFRVIVTDMENIELEPEVPDTAYSDSFSMKKIFSFSGGEFSARSFKERAEGVKKLSEKGEFSAALKLSGNISDLPSFRGLIAGIVKNTSSPEEWRRYLIERIAATGDPLYYYHIGNLEMEKGLDPLLYWEKALSLRSDLRKIREAADIFEHGSGSGSVYYSGRYTDFYPEFLRNGIRRTVTVRIFESGNYMTECEDILPASLAVKGESALLNLRGIRVLYALRCSKGEAVPLEFETVAHTSGSPVVKFRKGVKEGFVVLKYTGYSSFDEAPFYMMKDAELKRSDEDLSELIFEVSSELPELQVFFMDKRLTAESSSRGGETIYRGTARFNFKNDSAITASATANLTDRDFAKWYSGLVKIMKSRDLPLQLPLAGDTQGKIRALKEYTGKYRIEKGITFEPRFPEEVVQSMSGTAEELSILSSIILERSGVRGVAAFIRNRGDAVSNRSEAALFIPESKGRGEWIRFTEGINYKNREALILRGEGFEIIPVSEMQE